MKILRNIENQRSTWKHKQTRTIKIKYWSYFSQSPMCVMCDTLVSQQLMMCDVPIKHNVFSL
jgi:hypothetical protein